MRIRSLIWTVVLTASIGCHGLPGPRLSIQVLNADTGKPLAGAWLSGHSYSQMVLAPARDEYERYGPSLPDGLLQSKRLLTGMGHSFSVIREGFQHTSLIVSDGQVIVIYPDAEAATKPATRPDEIYPTDRQIVVRLFPRRGGT